MRWPARLRRHVTWRLRGSTRLRRGSRWLRRGRRRPAVAVGLLALGLAGAIGWPAPGGVVPRVVVVAVASVAMVQALLWRNNRVLLAEVRALTARGTGVVDRVEATQRRILAAVECERLAATERQRLLATGLAELRGDLLAALDKADERHRRELEEASRRPSGRGPRASTRSRTDPAARAGVLTARAVADDE